MLTHQLDFFRETIFQPLGGCWPLKCLHTLQSCKMYFNSDVGRRAASCWALPNICSFLMSHRISKLPWPIATKLCHVINICVDFIMQVQEFGGPPLKNLGPKTCKIWTDFIQLPTLIANFSGMRQDIQNRKYTWSRTIPPAFGETGPVNFGPLSRK